MTSAFSLEQLAPVQKSYFTCGTNCQLVHHIFTFKSFHNKQDIMANLYIRRQNI